MKPFLIEVNSDLKIELQIKSANGEPKPVKLTKAFKTLTVSASGFEVWVKNLSKFGGVSSIKADLKINEEGRYEINSEKDIAVRDYSWGKIFTYSTPTKGARVYRYLAVNGSTTAVVIKDSGESDGIDFESIRVLR